MTNGITNLGKGTVVWEAGEAGDFANDRFPELQILFNMGLSIGAIMIFVQAVYKAITIAELYKILKWDGTTMLCLGSLARIFMSAKEIWKRLK
jgi:hypothetical protein